MKTTAKRVSILTRITIIVFCLLLLCTLLSKTIYSATQVKVNVLSPQLQNLASSADASGVVEYPDKYTVQYPIPLQITRVLVQDKQAVMAGTPLFEIDMEEFNQQTKRLELAVLQIENQLSASGLTRKMKAELQLQLDIAKGNLAQYQSQIPQNGQILADQDSVISKIYVKAGAIAEAGSPLVELYPANAIPSVVFTLNDENEFQTGNLVDIRYKKVIDTGETPLTKDDTLTTSIEKKEYDPEKNQFRFYAPFQVPDPGRGVTVPIYEGQILKVSVYEPAAAYDCVVPSSAVLEQDQVGSKLIVFKLQERQGLFGDESYVQAIEVKKAAQNGMFTAIDSTLISPFDKVVVSSDGALSSGTTVQVIE